MRRYPFLTFALCAALYPGGSLPAIQAAVSQTGDFRIEPIGPGDGDPDWYYYIGENSYGTLTVDSGSSLTAPSGINPPCSVTIGRNSSGTGVVAVDGSGSTLYSSSEIVVGSSGSGTLNVTNGGYAGTYA